jgi:hypothetical protein
VTSQKMSAAFGIQLVVALELRLTGCKVYRSRRHRFSVF